MLNNRTVALSIDNDTFSEMKKDFDSILRGTIRNMELRSTSAATITMKLDITLVKTYVEGEDGEERHAVIRPLFDHDISSVMQVRDKKKGTMTAERELLWDDYTKEYVLRELENSQLSMFEVECEEPDRLIEEYEATDEEDEIDEETDDESEGKGNLSLYTPFGWLNQFVGQKLSIKEAMGNYTVRSEDDRVILTSAANTNNIFYCEKEMLKPHLGHNINCVSYKVEGEPISISIECEDCDQTLYSLDRNLDEESAKESSEDDDITELLRRTLRKASEAEEGEENDKGSDDLEDDELLEYEEPEMEDSQN